MQNTQTWRELLRTVIGDPVEKRRLAQELRVTARTLQQWVSGGAYPQQHQLYSLVNALPEYHDILLSSIAEEFACATHTTATHQLSIPSIFYAYVLAGGTSPVRPMRFWSLANLVMQQALGQLDPRRVGMFLRIAQCMLPTATGKVNSLRESLSLGTAPWDQKAPWTPLLLGSESLSARVVTTRQAIVIDRIHSDMTLPDSQYRGEISLAAYPIKRAHLLAGCLVICCTQPEYFVSPYHELAQQYADLLALAFDTDDFYAPHLFDLREMPPAAVQLRALSLFRSRVAKALEQSTGTAGRVGTLQVELQVWQRFEDEFLQLARS